MAATFKSPIVEQLETISLPDAEYIHRRPKYPFEVFDETLFKTAPFGLEMKRANFSLEENMHFLSSYSSHACAGRLVVRSDCPHYQCV